MLRRWFAASRYSILIAVLGCAALALALLGYGAYAAWRAIAALLVGELSGKALAFEAIRLVDLFLLAAVLHLIALGLCELFVDDAIPVPQWLQIRGIDDLKNKLLRVVVVVLAVTFLGVLLGDSSSRDILQVGGAVALVIAAIGYFLRSGEGH